MSSIEELIDDYISNPDWSTLLLIPYHYRITWDELKRRVEDRGGYMIRSMPTTRLMVNVFYDLCRDYESGMSTYELSVKYNLPKTSISYKIFSIGVYRDRINEFGIAKVATINSERNRLAREERELKYNSLPKFHFKCCACGADLYFTLSEIKFIFKAGRVPTCCDNSCSIVNSRLRIGFPTDPIEKTRLIYHYHSNEFKEELRSKLNLRTRYLSDISSDYGFSWKYLSYHLIPYHFSDYRSWISNYKSEVKSNRILLGLEYNLFKDIEWQTEYGGLSYRAGSYYSDKLDKEVRYRSSWELEAYKLLDKCTEVVDYEVEPFSLDYEFEGVTRKYLPDLLIKFYNGGSKLVEIKPSNQVIYDVNQAKFKSALDYCSSKTDTIFQVITEENWSELCIYDPRKEYILGSQ